MSKSERSRNALLILLVLEVISQALASGKGIPVKRARAKFRPELAEVTFRESGRDAGPAFVYIDKLGSNDYCRVKDGSCTLTVVTGSHRFIVVRPNRKVVVEEVYVDRDLDGKFHWLISDKLSESVQATLDIADNEDKSAVGASIYLDNAMVGQVPAKVVIEPGKHRLEVFKKGYSPYFRTISVELDPAKRTYDGFMELDRDLALLVGSEVSIKPKVSRFDLCEEVKNSNADAWYESTSYEDEGLTGSDLKFLIHKIIPKHQLDLEFPHPSRSMVYAKMRASEFIRLLNLGSTGEVQAEAQLNYKMASELADELQKFGSVKIPWIVSATMLGGAAAIGGVGGAVFRTIWGGVKHLAESNEAFATARQISVLIARGGVLRTMLHATEESKSRKFIHFSTVYLVKIGEETREYFLNALRFAVKIEDRLPDGKRICTP